MPIPLTGKRVALGILSLLVVGCAGEGPAVDGGSPAQVDTLESGRIAVLNPSPTWTEANAWTAEEDLRIGTLDGTGPDQFGQIASIKVDPRGRIYVLDFLTQDIRVFEPNGTYSHTIGSEGEGPGELMRASGLNWDAEGRLWVWDSGGRFSVFLPNGDFVESRNRTARGVIFPWRGEFDVDGSLVDWGLDYPEMSSAGGLSLQTPTRIVYHPVRFSGDFETGDTLPALEFEFELSPGGDRMFFGEGLSPFQDRQGTIWFAHNKTFTLYRRTLDGDTVLQTSIAADPARVAPHEVDSVVSIYTERGSSAVPRPDQFSETKPMIRRIVSDDNGHIFVLSDQEGLPLGTFVDVLKDSGEYLGRITLPAQVHFPYPPPTVTDSHMYYVTTDAFNVEYVVRMKLNKPDAG